ncbi:PEP/pyruvate-binding domain-containing protein [Nakamurella lactea]|uniref:PEP/pyruvate-binding domain-containing protein n=1 Tax=Nakamurella lactea TaxID=459515 RepID=UPI0004240A6D|nr:PEP/pyruvate-binding domain-containing protein [Nakamurella lactea]
MIVALRDAAAGTSGGKAAALAALLAAGLPVPDGFVIPFDSFRAAADGLPDGLRRPLPAGLIGALADGLEEFGDVPVAVRSSADSEDTNDASGAGQHDSVLGVRGVHDVADAVRTCWASLHSARAVSYRRRADPSGTDQDRPPARPAMAVLVQRLVDAEVSGVMFTPAGANDGTAIEASWGLGPSVVGGIVTPDSYRVAADGSIDSTISDKRTRIDRDGGRLVTRPVPADASNRPALDSAELTRLAAMGHKIADLLGGPQDVEWAITGGQLWILQSRPVTAAAPQTVGIRTAPTATLAGTPGSHGSATGVARVVRGADDFHRVRRGDILICPYTDPGWTPLLRIAAGVVTETGGVLCHAAIVARELRIPAVLGCRNATTEIRDGTTITIDGTTGTIVSVPS